MAHAANPEASGEQPSSASLFGLAPGGACLAAVSPRRRCALTAPFHLCSRSVPFGHKPVKQGPACRVFSVALSLGFPPLGVTQHPALRCPDFPQEGLRQPPLAFPRLPGLRVKLYPFCIREPLGAPRMVPCQLSTLSLPATQLPLPEWAWLWQSGRLPHVQVPQTEALAPAPHTKEIELWDSGYETDSRSEGGWDWARLRAG